MNSRQQELIKFPDKKGKVRRQFEEGNLLHFTAAETQKLGASIHYSSVSGNKHRNQSLSGP